MTTPAESTSTVISQLATVLALNLQRAATLEEAIEINNTGLPVDKFEESRSKKMKKDVVDVPMVNSMSEISYPMLNEAGTTLKESSVGLNSNLKESTVGLNSNGAAVPNSKEFLQVLSASPHIIVCYPQNGPMSYVLTVPTASTTNKKTPHSTILPNVYVPTQGEPETTESSPLFAKAGMTKDTMGKRKVTSTIPTVTQVLSSLLKNTEERRKLVRTMSNDVQNEAPVPRIITHARHTASKEDYNPESFSEFAKNLLTMDPLEASRMEDSSLDRTSSMLSSGSELTDSFGRESAGGISSRASCYNNNVFGVMEAELMDVCAIPDELVQDKLGENCIEMSNSENPPPSPCLATLVSAATGESLPATCTTTVSTFPPLPNNPTYVEAQEHQQRQQQTEKSISTNLTTSFQDMNTSGSSSSSDRNTLLQSDSSIQDISLNLDADTLQQLLQLSFSSDNHCPLTDGNQHLNDQGDDSTVTPEMPLSPISRFIDNLSPPPTLDFTQHMSSSLSFQSHTATNQQDHLLLGTSEVDSVAPNLRFQSSNSNASNAHPSITFNTGGSDACSVATGGVGVTLPGVVVSTASNGLDYNWSPWTSSNTQSIEQWLQESSSGVLSPANNSSSSPKTSLETHVNSHLHSADIHHHDDQPLSANLPPDIRKLISNPDVPNSETPALNHSNFTQYSQLQNGESSHVPLDTFASLTNDSLSSVDSTAASLSTVHSLLEPNTNTSSTPTRKISNTSTASEPVFDMLQVLSTSYDHSDTRHHLSLPNLTLPDSNMESSSSGYASPIVGGRISSPIHNMGSASPNPLQDIPEGIQMELESYMQYETDPLNLLDYRSNSPAASSPSLASVSSRSTVSIQDASMFDSDTPSVVELCEMLSETANVKHHDFSHMTLTGKPPHY